MTIRLIALVDINTAELKDAYATFYKAMDKSGLDWESSDEWYGHDGEQGDAETLQAARMAFMASQPKPKTKEEIIAWAEELGGGGIFDDEVDSEKSNEATDINNDSPRAQVEYLLSKGYDLETLEQFVQNVDTDEDR